MLISIEFALLIEFYKCLHCDNSISVGITVCNHFSNFGWSYIFLELFCTSNQIFRGNESFVVLVNVWEYSFNIVLGVIFTGVCGHKFNKFFETDFTSLINIEVWHGNVDKTSWGVKSSVLFNSFSEVQWG